MRMIVLIAGIAATVAVTVFCIEPAYAELFFYDLCLGWVQCAHAIDKRALAASLLIIVIAASGSIAAIHGFVQFFHRQTAAQNEWPLRRTIKIVALIIVGFVAGLALTGAAYQLFSLTQLDRPLVERGSGFSTFTIGK